MRVYRAGIVKRVAEAVTSRSLGQSLLVRDGKETLVYRRYASLYFIVGLDDSDGQPNAFLGLEIIHHLVELFDRYFGNVCELDLIFNFHKVHMMVDEVILRGFVAESSKKNVLRLMAAQDVIIEDSHHSNSPGLLSSDFSRRPVHGL